MDIQSQQYSNEKKKRFARYCSNKINKAISRNESRTNIEFKESLEMRELTYGEIDQVYESLKLYYFNNLNISINFERYNSVLICYLDTGKYNDVFDLNDNKHHDKFHEICQILYERCKKRILETPVTTTKLPIDLSDIVLSGYEWDFMYYFVSKKLQPMGWAIKKSTGRNYLSKIIIGHPTIEYIPNTIYG
jgi:hypothetical protein